MISRVRTLQRILPKRVVFVRYNSSKDKYSSIEEFNKQKTEYNIGSLDEDKPLGKPEQHTEKPFVPEQNEEDAPFDINAILENDPRLLKFRPGSAEYRDELRRLHKEFEENQQKAKSSDEFFHRMKGVGLGFLILVGIISGHQIFMNYDSLKNRLLMNYNYGDMKEESVKPVVEKNVKSMNYMLEKLTKELTDENLSQVQDSKERSGVYFIGDNSKIPLRIPFFNDMYLKDAYAGKGHLIAVTDKGKVYEWKKGWENARLVNLPFTIDRITPTNDFFYFLTNKGEVVYIPRNDNTENFIPLQRRNWFGLLKTQTYNKLDFTNASQIASGADHLLILNKKGQVYVVNSSEKPINRGQYGPSYSPFDKKDIPVNQPIELTLLNNKIVATAKGDKTLVARTFDSIASGKYFNMVSDNDGNIWTWGDNSFGQCGDINTTDLRPIPRIAFDKSDLKRILRNIVPGAKEDLIVTKKIVAGSTSSYVLVNYLNQDIIMSFGNGINGQLGGGRYMQVCCAPEIIKSLVGLSEFDESTNSVKPIGVKDISVGDKHLFITLDNVGQNKDVYAIGENENGQYGNGKKIKSCKPTKLPRLIEPEDGNDKLKLVKNLSDTNTKRLSLLSDWTIGKNTVDQVIFAGDDASIIYYNKKK
ncbi:FMP25 Protein FMP25 [Candida maltosa Xu316]